MTDHVEAPFTVTADAARGGLLVATGELDATTAPALRAALDAAAAAGDDEVHLDLTEVTFIDSSGLQSITSMHRELQAAGRELRIDAASRAVRRIFEVTGLRSLLVAD